MQSDTIDYAIFRKATKAESDYAHGGYLYGAATILCTTLTKIVGTYEMWSKGSDLLSWQTSTLQDYTNRFSLWAGWYDLNFIKPFQSFFVTRHVIDSEPKVARAFFDHHRNNGLYTLTMGGKMALKVLEQIFPEDTFNRNDTLFTCTKENTNLYRKVLHASLMGKRVADFLPSIKENAHRILDSWHNLQQNDSPIEVGSAMSHYAAMNLAWFNSG